MASRHRVQSVATVARSRKVTQRNSQIFPGFVGVKNKKPGIKPGKVPEQKDLIPLSLG
jgi:hypothetical protein